MKLGDVIELVEDCEECRYEVVFEDARDPSDEEYMIAVKLLKDHDPEAKLASIGVYAGTGDIYIETLDGEEYVIYPGSNELKPARHEDPYEMTEAAVKQFKRVGNQVKRRYRCLSGPKRGKMVATPAACATRKDPKKVRHGRKVMRSKKGTIARKTKLTKRKQVSRMVAKMNRRLSGKKV